MKNEFLIWNNSVENEVNKMEINHPQHWVIIEKYINYFEDWIKEHDWSKV